MSTSDITSAVRDAADSVARAVEGTAHDAASAVREVRDDAREHSRVTEAVEKTMTARTHERDTPS